MTKRILPVCLTLVFLPFAALRAATAPAGQVVELHACELYTGGCTASAWSTLGGRSLLRVWDFEKGEQNGISLAGLQIAALQVADKNLAYADTAAKTTVVYLPAKASDAQRNALANWLKNSTEFRAADLVRKTADIDFKRVGNDQISVKIGDDIALQTRAVEACDTGGCGEALWYSPRSKITGEFTVLVDEKSSVIESAISLVWKDHGARSVFLGRFDDGAKSDPTFHMACLD
jgi:hypothetical protein